MNTIYHNEQIQKIKKLKSVMFILTSQPKDVCEAINYMIDCPNNCGMEKNPTIMHANFMCTCLRSFDVVYIIN